MTHSGITNKYHNYWKQKHCEPEGWRGPRRKFQSSKRANISYTSLQGGGMDSVLSIAYDLIQEAVEVHSLSSQATLSPLLLHYQISSGGSAVKT